MQTTRMGTEPQKQRSYGGLSMGREREENGEQGTENKKHKWQVENSGMLRIVWEMKKSKNLYI